MGNNLTHGIYQQLGNGINMSVGSPMKKLFLTEFDIRITTHDYNGKFIQVYVMESGLAIAELGRLFMY